MVNVTCLAAEGRIDVTVADANRARWAAVALSRPGPLITALRDALTTDRRLTLLDSLSVIRSRRPPKTGAFVLLWDGLNSFEELTSAIPAIANRTDLRYTVVGWLEDIASAYPSKPVRLFSPGLPQPTSEPAKEAGMQFSPWVPAVTSLRTRIRSQKNALSDFRRHRALCQEPRLVFCGVVRPNPATVLNLMRSRTDPALTAAFVRIFATPLDADDDRLQRYAVEAYERIRGSRLADPEAIAAGYSMVNLLHRILTIAALLRRGGQLFLSEYGRNRHFDPYDSPGYRQHVYLDFGSTRGVEHVYPRTVDLQIHRKTYVSFRLHADDAEFVSTIRALEPLGFIATCEAHADDALVQLAERIRVEESSTGERSWA